MKGVREYLNAKPVMWTFVFGVPTLLFAFLMAFLRGLHAPEVVGLGLIICGFSILGIIQAKSDFSAKAVSSWPLPKSLAVFGGSFYLASLGYELALGWFDPYDLFINAASAAVIASFMVSHIKKNCPPEPPPVLTD